MENKLFIRFNYSNLVNEDHVDYHETLIGVFSEFNVNSLGIESFYVEYKKAFTDEVGLLDEIRASEYTEKMSEQDKVRDDIFHGLVNVIKGNTMHYLPDMRVHAKRLAFVLDGYGNIAKKTQSRETAAIDDLVRELRNTRSAELTALRLNDWVNALETENTKYKNLRNLRYTEKIEKPELTMSNARLIVDRLFRSILDYLEASILYFNGNVPQEFIKKINVVSEKYKTKIK